MFSSHVCSRATSSSWTLKVLQRPLRSSHLAFKSIRMMSTSNASPPSRPFKIHMGASWAGKNSSNKFKPFSSDTPIGAWRDQQLSRPKEVKSVDCGQDFFYIADMRNQSVRSPDSSKTLLYRQKHFEGVAFGVADGVGGWEESGVDPALFSQALMFHAHRYSKNAWAGEPEVDPTLDYEEREQIEGWEMTPYECLDLAYGGVIREKSVPAGASTACLITINASSGVLRSANLGDSGYIIVRSNSVLHKQRPQTHFFNCPKQLTKLPASEMRKFPRACVDSPSEAETARTQLIDGDIVIAFTDGMSDNVFTSEILTICSLAARRGGSEDEYAQLVADSLVHYAQQCGRSKTRISPFEKEAARHGMFFRGGKFDDVTVLVALVRETL